MNLVIYSTGWNSKKVEWQIIKLPVDPWIVKTMAMAHSFTSLRMTGTTAPISKSTKSQKAPNLTMMMDKLNLEKGKQQRWIIYSIKGIKDSLKQEQRGS